MGGRKEHAPVDQAHYSAQKTLIAIGFFHTNSQRLTLSVLAAPPLLQTRKETADAPLEEDR